MDDKNNTSMLGTPAAVLFIDKIIDEKGFEDLDDEVREELRTMLLQRMEDLLNRRIIEALTPKQLAHVEHMIDTKQVDKIQKYLYDEQINVQGIIAGVMTDFRAAYLGN
jgi:uncharacterized protein DUF5663